MDKIALSQAEPGILPTADKTPHSQSWGIPEDVQVHDLPIELTENQLKSSVLMIWREFMRHDEVLSAISFLENAPYRVRHSSEMRMALHITRKTIEWMSSKKSTDKVNTPRDPNDIPLRSEVTDPVPYALGGQVAERFNWVTNRLGSASGIKLIDFGCIDGTMTNRWGLMGHNVTGIDLSINSCAIANRKSKEFGTGAVHINCYFKDVVNAVQPNSFDVATCCDVYEHLTDPVNDLLIPARQCVRGNGRMLITTPHGSWMRGHLVGWTYPWKWIQEFGTWTPTEPRAHLVAPTVWSVSKHFQEAGWWVKYCGVVYQNPQDVPEQGNVCVEALAMTPPVWPGKKTVIVGYECSEKARWFAERFAELGNSVTWYGDWKEEKINNFVSYIKLSDMFEVECDVLMSDRMTEIKSQIVTEHPDLITDETVHLM
jgi:2-polyprenyl-3-methyl-5-hydroxy-6-metoxy-1,4-benzoquinol methylase